MTADLALARLGFTDLESRLYCELMREAPATGYRLAQVVGKAPANTYQALKSLVAKGAVVANQGPSETTSYWPIPPAELLSGLKKIFDHQHDEALSLLEGLHTPPVEEHVYPLNTVAQVVERARSMIAGSKQILLFDFFPDIYGMFADDLQAARDRGVMVAGLVYEAAHVRPDQPLVRSEVASGANSWPTLCLSLVVDCEQELLAQMSRDKRRLFSGVWSDSQFLSCFYHSALACEIRLVALGLEIDDGLKHISLMRARPPGMVTMLDRLGAL